MGSGTASYVFYRGFLQRCYMIYPCFSDNLFYTLLLDYYWTLQISSQTTFVHAATGCVLSLGTRHRRDD